MAISRMQQPRQLYGLGSFVKKAVGKVTKPFTKVAKKIVPREIAGIMRTAAPFLPPGYREAAYLLGTAKQTGRISPMDLALTAAPTFFSKTDMGKGIAQRVGDFKLPGIERDLRTLAVGGKQDAVIGRLDADSQLGPLVGSDVKSAMSAQISAPMDTQGIFGKGGDLNLLKGSMLAKPDGSLSLTKAGAAGVGVLSLIQNSKTPEEAGNALVAATGDSDDYERGVQLFSSLPQGIFDIPDAYRLPAQGGGLMRTNYARGAGDKGVVNPFLPKPIGPVLPDEDKPFTPKPTPSKMAEFDLQDYMEEFESVFPDMIEKRGTQEYMDKLEDYFRGLASKDKEGIMMAKEGGRANLALGTKPTPKESGLGGLPIEADMRYTGGFMPYGAVEKADDVPARLSKNEFVFTADAVRAAGGGSVNEGAKKMYTAMKQLEKKPEAKGMMA